MNHLKDPWTVFVVAAVAFVQWAMVHINIVVGVIMGLSGAVSFVYKWRSDRKKEKLLDIEISIKEAELRRINQKHTSHE